MNPFFRHLRMRLLTVVLSLATAGAWAQATPLKVQYYPGVAFSVTLYAAMAEGMFKKHGLDVELVGVNSGPAALAALSGESVELAAVNPDLLISARQRGLDFKAICAASGPYFELVGSDAFSRKPYPEVMRQVAGKKVGVNALGSGGQFFMEAMLEGAGIPKDSVTFVPVPPVAAFQAMQNKRVDVYMSFEPVTTLLTQSGNGKVIWSLANAEGPDALTRLRVGIVWIARADSLSKEPKKFAAFNQALEEAQAFVANPANADKVAAHVVKLSGVNTSGLTGGDATMQDVVKKRLLKANAITSFGTADADQWLAYVTKYQSDMLKGTGKPAGAGQPIAASSIWPNACK